MHIKEPAPSTLARYGLSLEEWRAMLKAQKKLCAVCGKGDTRLVIDHEHARGWKAMEDVDRKRYVRGLTCPSCNHFVLTRYADAKKHRAAARYLDRYARRFALENSD